ncbi:MAG: glutamine synthetase [Geminicoccaceae bacterium]|nr:glutamine synthetase [Geminicoccaceae bacterium]
MPLDAFLDAYPLIQGVEMLLPDLVGILRGKRTGLNEAREVFAGNGVFTTSLYAIDTMGQNVDESGLVWEEGDADRVVRLDPATLRPVPWRPERAQVIGGLCRGDGTPFFADPRAMLAGLVARFKALGLTPCVALELEFYLVDPALDAGGLAQTAFSQRLGRRPREPEVYTFERLDEAEEVLDLIESWCEAQDLPYKGVLTEYGPGQFEVNLGHVADAVRAADEAAMLKRLVKAAARQAGSRATFMAKPFAGESGNGLHIHVSLLDERGRNVFGEAEDGEDRLRHAVFGLQETLSESILLLAPNANSYRRLQPMSYAPTAPTWGHNNRTVAFRIPSGPPKARRIEHRVAGADANPYAATAAVLAGILHGLENPGNPGPPITGNAYEKAGTTIPTSWGEAIAAAGTGTLLGRYIDPRFLTLYRRCRAAERRRFVGRVTPTEYEWYLGSV